MVSFHPATLPEVPTAHHGKSQCPGTDRSLVSQRLRHGRELADPRDRKGLP